MNSKRKYAQISKKSSFSDGSPKQESKFDIKIKKRMKPSSNDDPKIVYELSRKKEISVAKDKFNRSNSIIFKDESKIEENSKKSESDHSHAKQLRFKTNDELLAELDIIEILTEEIGSEIEDIQSSIITALTDKFDIVEQEPDGNCLFRALSAGWFGSPTYFSEVRESVWDYILHNSERFKVHLPDEFDRYIETMLEDGEWGGEPEIVAFSELYNVNIHVFDAMTSPIPYLIAENNTLTHTIYLLLTNNNHFDLLLIRGDSYKIDFKKI